MVKNNFSVPFFCPQESTNPTANCLVTCLLRLLSYRIHASFKMGIPQPLRCASPVS